MKYHVVKSSNLNKVIQEVNRLMNEGWQPLGGIDSFIQGLNTSYHQAMIYRPAPAPPGKV